MNVPWPMGGMGNGDYMAAFNHVIVPIAHEYSPDLIIVSAGFDASAGDPIGGWVPCGHLSHSNCMPSSSVLISSAVVPCDMFVKFVGFCHEDA